MDVMFELLTSSRQIRKRDGSMQLFQLSKLESALGAALMAVERTDEALLRSLIETILERFVTLLVDNKEATTEDIRQIIVQVLKEQGLVEVMTRFASRETTNKPTSSEQIVEPTYVPLTSTVIVDTNSNMPSFLSVTTPLHAPSAVTGDAYVARRRRLNEERRAVTHKFQVGEYEGYLTVGLYDDGQPGEIFLRMNKEGSMMSGLMDAFATAVSIGLQYGVPLKVLVHKFAHSHFEPNGPTANPNIPEARSVMDYIFRWLALKFLTPEERQTVLGLNVDETTREVYELTNVDGARQSRLLDGSSSVV